MFHLDVPLNKVYINEYLKLLQEAQRMTQSEQLNGGSQTSSSKTSGKNDTVDYDSPVKVRWMWQAFTFLGPYWSDIGKANTGLNFMLSSPLFRHRDDPDCEKLHSAFQTLGLATTPPSETSFDSSQSC